MVWWKDVVEVKLKRGEEYLNIYSTCKIPRDILLLAVLNMTPCNNRHAPLYRLTLSTV